MNEPENISLAFNDLDQGGSSDKVYHISLSAKSAAWPEDAAWNVTIQYGRRGAALMSQTKCENKTHAQAKKVFDQLKREKMNKGYRIEGAAPEPQVSPSGAPVEIKPPELLEEVVNGDHLKYVNDPAYIMQDKSDGVSRGVVKGATGEIFGINKRGLPVPLPAEIVKELSRLPLNAFQIDAELVGTKLVCRDILVADGDISWLPYEHRLLELALIVSAHKFRYIEVVETWVDNQKPDAIAKARADRREGVVFKLRSAPYRPGRNGQHKKYKFIKTLSAIAGPPKINGKESVDLFLYKSADQFATDVGVAMATGGDVPCNQVRCGTVSLIGKPKVNEGDIVEVAYLYAQASGLLSQARLLHVRTDVDAKECTTAQLIYKREEEA